MNDSAALVITVGLLGMSALARLKGRRVGRATQADDGGLTASP